MEGCVFYFSKSSYGRWRPQLSTPITCTAETGPYTLATRPRAKREHVEVRHKQCGVPLCASNRALKIAKSRTRRVYVVSRPHGLLLGSSWALDTSPGPAQTAGCSFEVPIGRQQKRTIRLRAVSPARTDRCSHHQPVPKCRLSKLWSACRDGVPGVWSWTAAYRGSPKPRRECAHSAHTGRFPNALLHARGAENR